MRDFQLPGRSPAISANGMAATSHDRATLTALDVLRAGGNAVDAAIAASAVLCVVEPQSTGIGGDCWAIYAPASGGAHALNASGWAPAAATVERLRPETGATIDQHSPHAVTVPGAFAGWQALLEAHGTRSLGELLQPAIAFAEEGFAVTPRVAFDWKRAEATLRASKAGRDHALPGDAAPETGRMHRFPVLARTLRTIAEKGAPAFYRGELAANMVESLRAFGGLHTEEDFADYTVEWVEPIKTGYRGLLVYQLPPNGQGITALQMLNILETFELAKLEPHGARRLHLEAEATRLAYRDRDSFVADPRHAEVPVNRLLDKSYARELAGLIDPERAMGALPPPLLEPHPDTVYLTVVDRDLNAISFINSLYDSFGSGLVCPKTGVVFHSRGRAFRLDEAHPNVIAPRKRPLHTIIPGMAFKDGASHVTFGVMGGDYQPVGHARLITSLVDYDMDPQAAIDGPRAMAYPGPLKLERGVSERAQLALARMGHAIATAEAPLGGGQAILIDRRRGVLIGGSDPRKDGMALGY